MADVARRGGERIDRLARRLYGTERAGAVERLLDGNPGLAAISPDGEVAAGRRVETPAVPPPDDDARRIWE